MDRVTASRIWLNHLSKWPTNPIELLTIMGTGRQSLAAWEPIAVYNGRIADGLRRVQAAAILGIETIEVKELT